MKNWEKYRLPEQTEHNKKGHIKALELGFKGVGIPGHHSKVLCVVCGHPLPWYHNRYQKLHRAKCPLPGGSENV